VVEAGKKAFDSHGAGMSSARFICGTQVNIVVPVFYNLSNQSFLSNPYFTCDVIGEPLTNRNISCIKVYVRHQGLLAGVELTTFGL
jgi:hypothetical protein